MGVVARRDRIQRLWIVRGLFAAGATGQQTGHSQKKKHLKKIHIETAAWPLHLDESRHTHDEGGDRRANQKGKAAENQIFADCRHDRNEGRYSGQELIVATQEGGGGRRQPVEVPLISVQECDSALVELVARGRNTHLDTISSTDRLHLFGR